jgi:hypothetical protein
LGNSGNTVDVIVAFAFGKEETVNKALAQYAQHLCSRYNVPLYTQEDISAEITSDELKARCLVYVADESDGKYLSTLGIVLQFKELATRQGWKNVYLVATPPHWRRCWKDLDRAGFRVFVDSHLSKTYNDTFWFRKNDPQPHVRSKFSWWKREMILRALQTFCYPLYRKLAR